MRLPINTEYKLRQLIIIHASQSSSIRISQSMKFYQSTPIESLQLLMLSTKTDTSESISWKNN